MRPTPELYRDFRASLLSDENTRRLLKIFIALVLGGSIVYLAALAFTTASIGLRSAGIAVAFPCSLAALFLLRQDKTAAAVGVLIWGMWAALMLQICVTNGLMSRTVMLLPLIIVMAGWLLPTRSAIALCVASILAGLALALAERAGVLPLLISPSPPLLVWVAYAIYVSLASVIAYHVFRGFHLRHEALRKLGVELSERVETLAAREAELHLLMESVPAMIFHGDRDKRCIFANRSYAEFYASAENRHIGLTVREIIGEEAYRGVDEKLDRVLAGERLAYRGARKSPHGEEAILDIELLPELDEKGGTRGFFAVINNVTAQVLAEQALRASEERLRLAASGGRVGIWEWDVASNRLEWNEQLKVIFGLSPDATGLTLERFIGAIHADDLVPMQQAYLSALEKHAEFNCEYRIIRPDGSVHWIVARGHGQYDEAGTPLRMVGAAIDTTERKTAEEALRESREEFAKIFRASPVTILITNLESGRYLDVNDAFSRQFGWARDEAIGRTSVEIGIWPSREERDRWVSEVRQYGTVRDYEVALRTKSGNLLQTVVSAETIEIGGVPCVISLIHDITARKRAEEEVLLLNADLENRVKARTAELTVTNKELESFAYSISHDLRAPLRGIDGFSKLLLDDYSDKLDEQGRGYLDRVRRAAQRMGSLIDDILDLSRVSRHSMRHDTVDLSHAAAEILDELARAAPQRKVEIHVASGCSAVGDPQLLRVLLRNLLENAWKYTGKTAQARIEFGCENVDGGTVYHVRDNGVGFDMRYADRLFAPFQRLHPPGEFEGTGIGLATVARVAIRHGGRVWAESAVDRGTILRFTLGGMGK